MTYLIDQNQVFTAILFYTSVYNFSLILFFISLSLIVSSRATTTFYLANLPHYSLLNKVTLISLFSMAGIPPFVGFFSKLLIFVILSNSYMFTLFPAFFTLLFSGLYFYLQNLRLVLTNDTSKTPSILYIQDLNTKLPITITLLMLSITSFILFGVFFLEDSLLYTT